MRGRPADAASIAHKFAEWSVVRQQSLERSRSGAVKLTITVERPSGDFKDQSTQVEDETRANLSGRRMDAVSSQERVTMRAVPSQFLEIENRPILNWVAETRPFEIDQTADAPLRIAMNQDVARAEVSVNQRRVVQRVAPQVRSKLLHQSVRPHEKTMLRQSPRQNRNWRVAHSGREYGGEAVSRSAEHRPSAAVVVKRRLKSDALLVPKHLAKQKLSHGRIVLPYG